MRDGSDAKSPDPSDDNAASPPRAFVTATGFVYQVAGAFYVAVAGGYWLISGRLQDEAPVPIETVKQFVDPANVLLALTTLNILVAVAAGLAMVAFGIGLQGERRRSGIGAMITTGLLAAVALTSAVLYALYGPAWVPMVIVTLHGAVGMVLFLLAGHSAGILKRFPPPENQNVVDDAWLEEYARNRRRPSSDD